MFVQIWCWNFLAEIFLGWPKILERGTFMFVQIWCQNVLAKIFFWLAENFGGGYFYICPNLVSEFFGQKFWRGVLLHFFKNDLEIFSQPWGVPNMKTLECHETSRYAKIFDLGAFFVDHFGPQISG